MNPLETQSLPLLLVTVFVVFRFARRELRERTVYLHSLWIRPCILMAVSVLAIALSLQLDPLRNGELLTALLVGAVLGLCAGAAIVRNTTFAPASVANAVVVRGNRITLAIWIGALVVRFAVRYIVPRGADPLSQLSLNCGTVLMAAVAFVVIAIAYAAQIRRGSTVSAETA